MERTMGPVGQGTQARSQLGGQAGVRRVEVMQEGAGSLGAHVTQQDTLGPGLAVFYSRETFPAHILE